MGIFKTIKHISDTDVLQEQINAAVHSETLPSNSSLKCYRTYTRKRFPFLKKTEDPLVLQYIVLHKLLIIFPSYIFQRVILLPSMRILFHQPILLMSIFNYMFNRFAVFYCFFYKKPFIRRVRSFLAG